jgi:hypothetical protein
MKVVILAELLLGSKSVSAALTVAEFITDPVAVGLTTIVTTALVPAAKFPNEQVTGPASLQEPCVGVAMTKVSPDGNVSTMFTLVAKAGPLLVIVIR